MASFTALLQGMQAVIQECLLTLEQRRPHEIMRINNRDAAVWVSQKLK